MAKEDWMVKESELDDIQIRILMATLNKSCIITGCAGSGKSVLALRKALRIQNEIGNDYQVIVYTKALRNYMSTGRNILELHNDIFFYKEWRWVKHVKHYANGMSYMVYKKDKDNNMVPNMPKADYVIVDEIQDFTQEEIEEFISATKKNFFFFGDTAQSIYEGLKTTIPVEDIRRLVPNRISVKNWELYNNYRLPIPVAKVVQKVGIDLEPFDEITYKSKETAIPRFIGYNSSEDQIDAIHRIIKNNNMTDVAILLPHNDYVKEVYARLCSLGGNYEIRYNNKEDFRNSQDSLNFNSSNPKVMTYHSAKGLQFETVFLPYIENFDDSEISDRKALYVAMTRTSRDLYVMYSDHLPSPLSDIDRELYIETEIDYTKDI